MSDPTHSLSSYRQYDSSALQLISAWPKVLAVLRGEVPKPEVVEIFLTNYCNFHCRHCRFEEVHGLDTEYMPTALLGDLLDELAGDDVPAIELSGGGEPLVHPDIISILDMFIERDIRIGVITNGYALIDNEPLASRLIVCADWIRFSVDAFTDETYRSVHGTRDAGYTDLADEIVRLVKARRGMPKIGLKMLISELNASELPLALEEGRRLGVDYVQLKFLGHPCEIALGDEEMQRVSRDISAAIDAHGTARPVCEHVPPYRGTPRREKCLMTWLHPVVDWDGEIYVCAFFEHRRRSHSLGNIGEAGFFTCWNAAEHRRVFDAIDPATCVPNCPMQRYRPLIDFIESDNYRFRYI